MGRAALLGSFVTTLLLSAFLLFLVQPMFGKMVLPLLGGSPSVWTTAMLFFQATLLAGYAYAHLIVSRMKLRRQMVVHIGVLAVPLLLLPVALPQGLRPPTNSMPVGWLLLLMATTVGPAFFAVSTTAPLLQRWFSQTDHPSARDPYFLYAASNVGSLVALVGYPLVVERALTIDGQSDSWAIAYAVLVLAVAGCAAGAWRRRVRTIVTAPRATHPVDSIGVRRWLRWVALALVPSSLMIGVTNHLTTDIAAIPLLWVIPLTLYLMTFIVTFSKAGPRVHPLFRRAAPFVALALFLALGVETRLPVWAVFALHLSTFFVIAMAMHGELNRDRPAPERLTEFYLAISIGGALGGLINAVIAPVVLDSLAEYEVMIVAGILLLIGTIDLPNVRPALRRVIRALPAVGLVFAASLKLFGQPEGVLVSERNFFGVHRVSQNNRLRELVHGNTVHGAQSRDRSVALVPLTYYHPTGPAGEIFESFRADPTRSRVAIVGLGAGSLSCYGRAGDEWTFYEIDRAIERIARDLFTFLEGCGVDEEVIIGDARLTITEAADDHYDLIVIDAFSSDSIPVHLVTAEAVDLYLSKLSTSGLLAFHISNRYLDISPVLAALADDQGLAARRWFDTDLTPQLSRAGKARSDWVLMSEAADDLGPIADDERWTELERSPAVPAWTDAFSNVLGVVDWD